MAPELLLPATPPRTARRAPPPTNLSTDSTNTRSALTCTQAIKASLKFTLSQRSRGPCRDRGAVTLGPSANPSQEACPSPAHHLQAGWTEQAPS